MEQVYDWRLHNIVESAKYSYVLIFYLVFHVSQHLVQMCLHVRMGSAYLTL